LRLPPLFRTTAARLSALYLILFAVCALILVVYVTSLSSRMLVAQTRETIQEEVATLASVYRRGGLPLLARVIERRARQPGANLYLMADPQGRVLAGNVASLEPGVLEHTGWTERSFRYERYGEGERPALPAAEEEATGRAGELRHYALAEIIRLPNRMILLVGRDLGEPERFTMVMRQALAVAFAMMGVGALVIWFLVGRQALRRIDSVTEASARIMAGDLSRRLPVTGSGDEFDRLSENLNGMLARIARLNEGLKQVADSIAHDLKTPLTRLRNRAEAALSGARTPEEYREALEATIAESEQLIRIFNAILMISRLEAGQSGEATGPVDLAMVVHDVVELYEPAAEEMGVRLVCEVEDTASVQGNRELIGQALSNIIDNAIKYSAGTNGEPEVRVSLHRHPDELHLVVDDNGPGIPEEERQRVTERFVRLETSRTRPGSGLGLSLAKAVMSFHDGQLELSGREPGLRVTMVFPAGRIIA
jgi:signal transduction histidine kinase